MKKYFISFAIALSFTSFAQPLPDTEIFLSDLKIAGEKFEVSKPVNITNRNGYDNQPSFLPDPNKVTDSVILRNGSSPQRISPMADGLFFVSMQMDSQTDVFQYNFLINTITQITKTKEHEYSPTVMADGKHFSTVRIESPDTTQRLWKFDLDGTNPSLVLEKVKLVGYHCWYDEKTLILFLVTNPESMVIAKVGTEETKFITEHIGRCIQKIPNEKAISFVQKENDTLWTIQRLDMTTFQTTKIISTLQKSEDYVWTKDGVLLMGKENKLYKFNPAKDKDWQMIADFSPDKAGEIKEIYRLAINPKNDKIAMVGVKK